jgi:fatty-acyl-CoA synthase
MHTPLLRGLMQDHPLLVSTLIEFADTCHGDTEIVSRRVEGDLHRTNWAAVARRARQVANRLDADGVPASARVATLAWNGYRHLELYYGVSGSGRVLHTLNPRLSPEQVVWIVNHAEDEILAFDMSFLPLVSAIQAQCPSVKRWVALCDAADVPPDSAMPNLVSYESWIGGQATAYDWPLFDENAACSLCYTSGTTGHPKGVLYSHRSTVLHAYAAALPDTFSLSARDTVLPVVPMFHVNAWGLPYAAALAGAKLVFPGPALDGKSVYELIEAERVTFAAGVPTVWQMLLGHLDAGGLRFSSLRRTVVGGAACPSAMIRSFEDRYGVEVRHAWGMTEISPVGTVCTPKSAQLARSSDEQLAVRLKQGRAPFGVRMKIVDGDGHTLPNDGQTVGDLLVRGPWVVSRYFKQDASESPLVNGWFPTGDMARIDADGFLQITDRSKDLIKSGGEWISSIDIENIAMAHPGVATAACIGVPHPKWDERPVLVVARKPGSTVTREQLLALYQGKVAKWQTPDDAVFVDAIPLGATGKILKTRVRQMMADYRLPGSMTG